MAKHEQKAQAGVFLVALLVNIAAIVTLTAGAVGCAAYVVKAHEVFVGDMVMQEQIRFAAETITRDIAYAETAEITEGQLVKLTLTQEGKNIIYEIKGQRLVKDTQPLTGDDRYCPVRIKEFCCERYGANAILFKITAFHEQSRHEFSLEGGTVMLNGRKSPDAQRKERLEDEGEGTLFGFGNHARRDDCGYGRILSFVCESGINDGKRFV